MKYKLEDIIIIPTFVGFRIEDKGNNMLINAVSGLNLNRRLTQRYEKLREILIKVLKEDGEIDFDMIKLLYKQDSDLRSNGPKSF